jgi:proline iminopeptidase
MRPAEPRFVADRVLTFVLDELPEGRTRLVVRSFGVARPRLLPGAADLVFWGPAHVVMQTHQLRNLKQLAEGPLREPLLRRRCVSRA